MLPAVLEQAQTDVVYACGPMAMLRAVSAVATAHGAIAQCAVEESMACGIGVCMTCVLPVRGEDGRTRMVRSCVEGPVFRGDRVRWDAIGTVPADTVGAPASAESAGDPVRDPPGVGARGPPCPPAARSGETAVTHFVVLSAAERDARDLAADAVDMSTDLAGVALPNPVLTASGCAAAGQELSQFFDVTTLGAVVTKSIMAEPRSGRPTPRMAETPSGMLNSIGLQGPGIEAFLDEDLRWLAERGARTVVSIAGGTVAEFAALADRLSGNPAVSAVEVNISCPNVANRGLVFACDPYVAAAGDLAPYASAWTGRPRSSPSSRPT